MSLVAYSDRYCPYCQKVHYRISLLWVEIRYKCQEDTI